MTAPIRLALVGKSGSGKTHAGEFLSKQLGIRNIKTGAICREIARLLFGNEDKRSTQILDDALTPIDPSIFVKAALRSVSEQEGFVLDALRFGDDLLLARQHGCHVIRLAAPESVRVARLKARGQVFDSEVDGNHRSETELDQVQVDYEIMNDSDLRMLESALLEIASGT
jgi:dephospho-CoA kinase